MAAKRGSASAVIDGVLKHVSVSQIKTYLRCPRLWYADKVLGIRPPRKPGAERGTNLHEEPEAYYLYGTEPKHEAFIAALQGLPARHPDLLVEHHLTDPTLYVEDVKLDGYSDLIVPPHCSTEGIPEIRDWKFLSSLRYMEDPANDLQMLVYGYWASKKWPEAREIKLGLHYFLQDGSDFKPRVKTVPIERCESEWEEIVVPTVKKMGILAAQRYTLEECPDNRGDACYAYGGCHLMEPCGVVTKGKAARGIKRALDAFDSGLD